MQSTFLTNGKIKLTTNYAYLLQQDLHSGFIKSIHQYLLVTDLISFFAGKYYNKHNFNHDDDARDKIIERRFNPFDPEQCEILPKHFNKQFIFGLSVSTGQHLEFVINFIPGQIISYAEYAPAGFCATGYYKYYRNNDFLLSIKYKILRSTKGISTTDNKLAALNNVYKILPE